MDDRPAQPGQLTGEKGVNDYHNGDNLGLEPTTPSPEPPAAPQAEPSDEEIDAIAASMPDGAGGMLKQWGYRQFARALLARYGARPAASVEPVARIYRKGFQHGSIVWTAAGLAADLPDGTELYAAIDAAQAQPKRRPYNASGSLSEYGIFPECDAAPAAQPAANPEPSDEEILSMIAGNNHPYTEAQFINFARALLSRYGRPARDADEYQAMLAVMEQIDPATFPGLTAAQRCALGRFAKPLSALPQRSAGE